MMGRTTLEHVPGGTVDSTITVDPSATYSATALDAELNALKSGR